ncbi:MAG: alpha-glucosidase/alpha-galactosidase, partial [Bacilli bacterium]
MENNKKICFIGAGSTIFLKNLLGDCLYTKALESFEYALYDIDSQRLDESYQVLQALNQGYKNKAIIKKYDTLAHAVDNAQYVINAIQVGTFETTTAIDFQLLFKYGLKQCIG